jgi:hypothetical protein
MGQGKHGPTEPAILEPSSDLPETVRPMCLVAPAFASGSGRAARPDVKTQPALARQNRNRVRSSGARTGFRSFGRDGRRSTCRCVGWSRGSCVDVRVSSSSPGVSSGCSHPGSRAFIGYIYIILGSRHFNYGIRAVRTELLRDCRGYGDSDGGRLASVVGVRLAAE